GVGHPAELGSKPAATAREGPGRGPRPGAAAGGVGVQTGGEGGRAWGRVAACAGAGGRARVAPGLRPVYQRSPKPLWPARTRTVRVWGSAVRTSTSPR